MDFEVIADEAVTSTDALLSASSVMAAYAESVTLYFKDDREVVESWPSSPLSSVGVWRVETTLSDGSTHVNNCLSDNATRLLHKMFPQCFPLQVLHSKAKVNHKEK